MDEWYPAIVANAEEIKKALRSCNHYDERIIQVSGKRIRVRQFSTSTAIMKGGGKTPDCFVEIHPEDAREIFQLSEISYRVAVCRHCLLMD